MIKFIIIMIIFSASMTYTYLVSDVFFSLLGIGLALFNLLFVVIIFYMYEDRLTTEKRKQENKIEAAIKRNNCFFCRYFLLKGNECRHPSSYGELDECPMWRETK